MRILANEMMECSSLLRLHPALLYTRERLVRDEAPSLMLSASANQPFSHNPVSEGLGLWWSACV